MEADPRLTNCESDCNGIPNNSPALKRLFWEEVFLVALKVRRWPSKFSKLRRLPPTAAVFFKNAISSLNLVPRPHDECVLSAVLQSALTISEKALTNTHIVITKVCFNRDV